MIGFIISIVYSIPCIILYFSTVMIVICNWKHMKSSFYQFYIFEFFMNMWTFLNGFSSIRLPNITCKGCFLASLLESLREPSIGSQILFEMQFHMAFVQYSTTTIVAINRMTLMCYPGFFKKSWSSYGWILMVLIVILPFSVTYHVFLHDAYFQYNATFDRFSLESEYPSFILFSRLFYFMCACSSITIIVNVMTFHKIRSLWYKPDNLEVNYFLVTFVASVVQIIGTLLTYAMIIATPNTALFRMTNIALPFVSDALTLLQPILLVIFCSETNMCEYPSSQLFHPDLSIPSGGCVNNVDYSSHKILPNLTL
ncbi:hypothetical protein CAEBREN_23504 [Caenorhabditis brenneri]|uniref:Serpentine receptor class gamma n=1 Tax=Caenorhabditis brenneri TaxID=135651 RepID=G0N8K1_CAEBE|nr:hypothetical protein CAEBREN_23504 [Caenorhabditis brenneri]